MLYEIHTLADTDHPGSLKLIDYCQNELESWATSQGAVVYGVFASLFGLASNEVYFVVMSEQGVNLPSMNDGISQIDCHRFMPTSRPTTHNPPSETGVYVFRWFLVEPENIAEIVRLSVKAWETFEGGFNTEVKGLFAAADPPDPSGNTRMLLITWYENLSVWEASRDPAPEARENFLRRAQLTRLARPIATRLITRDAPAGLISDK